MRRDLLLALALLGAAPGSAAASPAWTAPSALTAAGAAVTGLQVQAATDGSAVLSFQQGGSVFAAVKQPGALFGAPVSLGTGTDASLAMAANGRALLAWRTGTTLHTALREPGAAALAVSAAAPVIAGLSKIATAAAADGRAYVATAATSGAAMSTIAPGSATLTAAATISTLGTTGVAIATQDGGAIAWLEATAKSGSTASALVRRWSATLGVGALQLLRADSDVPSNNGGSSTTYSVTDPVAISGPHPTFLWDRSTYVSGFVIGSYTDDLLSVAEPIPASPAPTVLDTGSSAPSFTSFYRSYLGTAVDASSGSAAVAWSTSTGMFTLVPSSIEVSLRSTTSGAMAPPVALPSLTAPSDQPSVVGVAVASAGGGANQLVYDLSGRVLTTPMTATGALPDAEPVSLPVPKGATPASVRATGTGTGDVAAAWLARTTTDSYDVIDQIQTAFGDATPPTLALTPPPQGVFPAPTSQAQADALNAQAHALTFDATASDTWTPTTVTWDFGDGATATGLHVSHTFAATGAVHVKATATDLAGNATIQTLNAQVDVFAYTPPAAVPTPVPVPLAKQAVVSAAQLSAKTFAVASGKAAKTKGAKVTFSLSASATVELTVVQPTKGYRSGTKCVAKKPKSKKTPKRCVFDKLIGLAGAPAGAAGANSFAFSGKVAGKALKPGKYKLLIASIPPGQSHGTSPVAIRFTIRK